MSSVAIADRPLGRGATFAVILAACLISLIGFGTRASFGLYLEPMTVANGWSREIFGLAMAIQNLLWGVGVPVAGAIADRYGPGLVIAVGTVISIRKAPSGAKTSKTEIPSVYRSVSTQIRPCPSTCSPAWVM